LTHYQNFEYFETHLGGTGYGQHRRYLPCSVEQVVFIEISDLLQWEKIFTNPSRRDLARLSWQAATKLKQQFLSAFPCVLAITPSQHMAFLVPGRFFDGHFLDGHILDGHFFDWSYFRPDTF